MPISIMDVKKRIVLPQGRPGDVFDIQEQGEGLFVLVRLQKPEKTAKRRISRKACLEAMRNAPLRPAMTWEELRKLIREP
jgi:hypothetical protein